MAGRLFTAFTVSPVLLSLLSVPAVRAADDPSANILVDYSGSWELRYKVYFSEIGKIVTVLPGPAVHPQEERLLSLLSQVSSVFLLNM
jgi:hypothetical protein